jgi:hypothetical protein
VYEVHEPSHDACETWCTTVIFAAADASNIAPDCTESLKQWRRRRQMTLQTPSRVASCLAAHAVAFKMFDIGGTGYVTESDLLQILETGAGTNFSLKQLQTVRTFAAQGQCSTRLLPPETGCS